MRGRILFLPQRARRTQRKKNNSQTGGMKMAILGHGYGSEFHLLRWMGRHREEFTRRVSKIVGSQTVTWFDFNFNNRNSVPDGEIHGFSFLGQGKYQNQARNLLKRVRNKELWCCWPDGGNSISWDAVGRTESGRFILCEAKAHKKELVSSISRKTTLDSRAMIFKALEGTKEHIGIDSRSDWRQHYYQLANRLYVQAVLDSVGIDAVLLNIYFIGDAFPSDNTQCPATQDEWEEAIKKEYETLGIPRKGNSFIENHVRDLFLPVSLEKGPRVIGPWGYRIGIVRCRDKAD